MTIRITSSRPTALHWPGLASLFFAFALVGCGGGGGSDSANPRPEPSPPPVVPDPPPAPPPSAPPPAASEGNVSLLAGSIAGSGNLDGTGSAARFSGTRGVALDAQGNLYVADYFNHRIRKVTPAGVVTTFAGSGRAGYADGTAGTATFCNPTDVAVDANNNVFVADTAVVRKISADGIVTTVAGKGPVGCGSPMGLVPPLQPRAVAVDRLGFVYIANASPSAVYRLSPGGELIRIAGDETRAAEGNGSLGSLTSIAVDDARNVYVGGDFSNFQGAIFKIATDGKVTTVVPTSAGLGVPTALAVDRDGTLVFAGGPLNDFIRAISLAGAVTVRVSAVAAAGVAIGADGGILFSARNEDTIRKADSNGSVTTVAGSADPTGPIFRSRQATDHVGNTYILEQLSQPGTTGLVLQRIAPDGQKTTLLNDVAGTQGLTADAEGNVYLAQTVKTGTTGCGFRICFITCGSEITRIDAQGKQTKLPRIYTDANGAEINLDQANALAADASGNLFVADRKPNDSAVYRITPAGAISTVAAGRFALSDIAVNPQGTQVYAASCPIMSNPTGPQIVRYGLDGTSAVLAGPPTDAGAADGIGMQATFGSCQLGIALDPDSNVFVADTANDTVRKVTAGGAVSTVVGRTGLQGITLGPLPASLLAPIDVSFDGAGNLYVGSYQAILKVRLAD